MLDTFAAGKTAVHRLDPAGKTVASLLVILAVVLVGRDHFLPLVPVAAALAVYHVLGRTPIGYTLHRLAVVSPFAVAMVVLLPFVEPGEVVWQRALGPWTIEVTREGLVRAAGVTAKFTLCVWVTLLLLATTRFQDVLQGLTRLRVPRLFVVQLAFLYRYLWVLMDEVMRLRQARAARDAGLGPWRMQFQSHAGVVGVLFIKTYDRAERIYWAMAARGFDGTVHAPVSSRLRVKDWALVAAAAALGAGVILWDRLAGGG